MVRKLIIDPILECLNWTLYNYWGQEDFSGCLIETQLKFGKVDYALIHQDKFKVFIEAKRATEVLINTSKS